MESEVKQKFSSYPDHIKPKMEALRKLILEVARSTEGVGELEETLKWGEPAYLPSQTKSGTTVRIDWKSKSPKQIGMYVSCNTSLVRTFRSMFEDELQFEGNRAIVFPVDKPIPKKQLMICIQMAFRYHLDKKQ
ncbi:DUF1801 domain-containing protein [Fodinibius halophilus]|uniref:DUF1801 domain-containing protein n=1 Tax=Fodinibius halophilus TaxID=1736908 RepID=A0A6M1T732_9BACT|nr:DUF1801 domain-containing protein [Fodinibius halophilus]NGP89919.1 DUF1801 domain-containing protein [Fodinibius halophilus]